MRISDLDRRILGELRKDCRTTYEKLSRKTGTHLNTIANRIKKLEKEGIIIGYRAALDYYKLGYGIFAVLYIKMLHNSKSEEQSIKRIISMPETTTMATTSGSYDLVVVVRVKNFEDLIRVQERIGQERFITDMRTEIILEEYKRIEDFNPFLRRKKPAKCKRTGTSRPLDRLDIKILEELRKDGKATLRKISEVTDAPITTIKDRIKRLEDDRFILCCVADIDFFKLGYQNLVHFRFTTPPKDKNKIIKKVNAMQDILALYAASGPFTLHAAFLSKGSEHLEKNIRKLREMGVVRTDIYMVRKIHKFNAFNPLA